MKKWLPASLTVLALLFGLLSGCAAHQHVYTRTVIPPTCNSIGYTINACSCGDTFYSDYQAMTAHSFGSWIAGQEATLTEGGEEYCICSVCGILQTRDTENRSSLPKLYLTDFSKTDSVQVVSLLYSAGESLRFSCQAVLTVQNSEALKTEYVLQLVTDESGGTEYPVDLGWGEQNTYCLRTQYPDPTLTRAAAAEALWNARDEEQDTTASYLPIQVYQNGTYAGLYTLAPTEAYRFSSLAEGQNSPTAALRAEEENGGCLFQEIPTYTDARTNSATGGFAFIYCSTEDTAWATGSFSGFSEFVRKSKDAVFREQLSQYTDTTVLIDYFLFLHFFGVAQGDTVGTVWYTADGIHWLPTFSNLQTSYGLLSDGSLYDGEDGIPLPDASGTITYSGNNLLWKRLTEVFANELTARYQVLRDTVLKPETIYLSFLEPYKQIEPELFVAEATAYPLLSKDGGDTARILTFLRRRLDAMDRWLKSTEKS